MVGAHEAEVVGAEVGGELAFVLRQPVGVDRHPRVVVIPVDDAVYFARHVGVEPDFLAAQGRPGARLAQRLVFVIEGQPFVQPVGVDLEDQVLDGQRFLVANVVHEICSTDRYVFGRSTAGRTGKRTAWLWGALYLIAGPMWELTAAVGRRSYLSTSVIGFQE